MKSLVLSAQYLLSNTIMKYLLLLLFIPILSTAQVSGPRWYVKIGAGFGTKGFLPAELSPKSLMPSNSSFDLADGTIQDMTNSVDSLGQRSYVHDTYTKGLNYYLGAGYKLSKYWGIEMGVLWLQGGKITSHNVNDNNPLLGQGAIIDVNTYARGLAVIPSLTLDIPLNEKWLIQAHAGLTVPVYGKIYHDAVINAQHTFIGPMTGVLNAETQATFSLGINGGVGIHRKLGKRVEVFFDVIAQHMNLNGKHLKVVRYDLTIQGNAVNQLETNPGAYHSEINFVNELTAQSNNKASNANIDESKPKDDLLVTSPFSNVGFGAGIMFWLGKTE
jgi:hypothetical protein